VITGTIADKDDRLVKGDRVFFINEQSTAKVFFGVNFFILMQI